MLNLNSILINTGDPKTLTKFYEGVFQKPMDEMMGWQVGNVNVAVLEHSEIKGKSQEGARIMFNLEAQDVRGEFERIKAIEGAQVIKEPYQMTMEGEVTEKGKEVDDGFWIATLADPDGNYFQLMSPWDEGSSDKA